MVAAVGSLGLVLNLAATQGSRKVGNGKLNEAARFLSRTECHQNGS